MPRLLRWLLASYIFFLPVQFDVGAARAAPSDLFIIAYAVLGIGYLRAVRRAWSIWHFALIGVFLMGVIEAVIRDGALTVYVLINKTIGLAVLFLTYWIITSAADSFETVRWMLRVFIIAVSLHSALSAASVLGVQILGINPMPWMNYLGSRASGMLIDPNAFGGLVIVALAVHATTLFGGDPLLKGLPGYVSIACLALALILTLSRSAWIGMAAAAILGTLARPKLLAVYAGAGLLVTMAVVLAAGAATVDSYARIANRPNTAQQRIDQIKEAWPMIEERPLLGSGLGAFVEQRRAIIHNTTVWILTELGLVGLTVYLGYMLWFYQKGYLATRLVDPRTRALIVGLLCAHLGMQAVSVGIEAFYQRHWWFTMALLASCYSIALRRARQAASNRCGAVIRYGRSLHSMGV